MRKNWGAGGGRFTSSSSFATTTNQFSTTSCLLVCLGLPAGRPLLSTHLCDQIFSQNLITTHLRMKHQKSSWHGRWCPLPQLLTTQISHTNTHTHTCLHIQDQILRVLWIECWEFWKTRLISLKGLVSEGWEFWNTEIVQFRDLVFWWIEWVCVGSFLGEIGEFKNLLWGLGLLGFCFACCWIVFEGCWCCYYLISFCWWDCFWGRVGCCFCCYCTSSIRVSSPSHIFLS